LYTLFCVLPLLAKKIASVAFLALALIIEQITPTFTSRTRGGHVCERLLGMYDDRIRS
jgi:hypothetical protein